MLEKELLICGGGPTGLGAAWRLNELSECSNEPCDWLLVEAGDAAGGMAVSAQKDGFTWDLGGHVLFPHYSYFDAMLDEVVDDWVEVKPVRGAWMFKQFIPYPVQRNIRYFPVAELQQCLDGMSKLNTDSSSVENFEQHLTASFGEGLYNVFFEPLNLKMWGTHPSKMSAGWTQHKSGSKTSNVPTIDLDRIKNNISKGLDDLAWDDDTRIRYPAKGGTGAVWQGVMKKIPTQNLQFNQCLVAVNLEARIATLANGEQVKYENLITSMPIDMLLKCLIDSPELTEQAQLFIPAVVDVVGVGVSGECPEPLKGICSLYIPDNEISFWRTSVMSNYSASMAPQGTWSILCEINSGSQRASVNDPVETVIKDLEKLGFVNRDKIVSTWHQYLPYGYPVPTLERDKALSEIQKILEANGIYSRGRFGGWKYEVCNQDHAFMQGVEVVDALLSGTTEVTYPTPHLAGKSSIELYKTA